MLLPYVSILNYWMWEVPQFEWQPESQDPTEAPVPGSSLDACADTTASVDSTVCADTVDGASRESSLPRMRLVMTGVRWVAVPYWIQRENPHWESMVQDGRDEDRRRNEANALQVKRRLEASAYVKESQQARKPDDPAER